MSNHYKRLNIQIAVDGEVVGDTVMFEAHSVVQAVLEASAQLAEHGASPTQVESFRVLASTLDNCAEMLRVRG